jgi:DNA-binding CsgD family transcriptional regulator
MESSEQPVGVYGRDSEWSGIRDFLDSLAGGPRALLIEGEAGIGKTSLWSAGVEAARRRGFWVLCCRCVQSEVSLTFSCLCDLLEPVPETSIAELPAPQRGALDAALLRAEPGPEPPDQRAVAAATLRVVRKLTGDAPVLIAVDDWPWLDLASRAVVEYALRRLDSEPAGLLATARSEELAGQAAGLGDLLPRGRVRRLEVGPLGLAAFAAMFDAHSAEPVRGADLISLHGSAGGNPLFGLELLAAAGSGGQLPVGQPLPVPTSVGPLLRRRLATLPGGTMDLVLLLAASPRPTAELAAAACGDPQQADQALDVAEAADVLEVADGEVRFVHPLLRSLAYSGATERQRRRAHERLAGVTQGEERARHRALAAPGPDEQLAGELDAAARLAQLRGAAPTAAELADLALALTPAGSKDARTRRLITAGPLHLAALDTDGARRLLEDAVASCPAGPQRAEALFKLATATRYTEGCNTIPLLEQALEEVGGDQVMRAAIHRDLGLVYGNTSGPGSFATCHEHYRQMREIAQAAGDDALIAQSAALQAGVEFITGNGIRRDLIDAAVRDCQGAERMPVELHPKVVVSHVLLSIGDCATARTLLLQEYDHEMERGAETDLPVLIAWLVQLETCTGHLAEADRFARQGYDAALISGAGAGLVLVVGMRALLRAWQGREEEARLDAKTAMEEGTRIQAYVPVAYGAHAIALLELAAGNPAAAHARLGPVTELMAERLAAEPGWIAARMIADDIEALIRIGSLAEADALLTPLEESAMALDRSWAIAAMGRCRALLASASGDTTTALAALRRALAAHEHLDHPLELARTHLVAGEVARRARSKRAAREHMQTARDLFAGLGAVGWARRADEELARLTLRGAQGQALTDTERAVARLVAAGHTNREVATELYMGLRTVEAHLSQVYRKLGVRSRSELARWWAEQG